MRSGYDGQRSVNVITAELSDNTIKTVCLNLHLQCLVHVFANAHD